MYLQRGGESWWTHCLSHECKAGDSKLRQGLVIVSWISWQPLLDRFHQRFEGTAETIILNLLESLPELFRHQSGDQTQQLGRADRTEQRETTCTFLAPPQI